MESRILAKGVSYLPARRCEEVRYRVQVPGLHPKKKKRKLATAEQRRARRQAPPAPPGGALTSRNAWPAHARGAPDL